MQQPVVRAWSAVCSFSVCFLSCLLLSGSADLAAQPTSTDAAAPGVIDPSDHRLRIITVDGVQVPYLDWGGAGVAIVFLAGAGNTAHVFDDFAPRFTDEFRVLAVTRVGFGESGQPEGNRGTDLESRVGHIRAMLDTEEIDRAVLIGHSLGGDEITAFAGAFPERTSALIYLDSGVDHTVTMAVSRNMTGLVGQAPQAGPSDLASVQAYRRFLARVQGVEFPVGEVLATTVFDATGAFERPRMAPFAAMAVINSIAPPDFTGVQAPALALFSNYSVAELVPWLDSDSEVYARLTTFLEEQYQPVLDSERAGFANAIGGAQVFAYPAHHYQFLSMPDDTELRIRAFMSSIDDL